MQEKEIKRQITQRDQPRIGNVRSNFYLQFDLYFGDFFLHFSLLLSTELASVRAEALVLLKRARASRGREMRAVQGKMVNGAH